MDTLKNKIVLIGMALLMIATLVLALIAPNVTNLIMTDEERLAMTYPEFTDSDFETESENVIFGAYFARDLDGDGWAEKLSGTTASMSNSETLYIDLNVVSEGKFENGTITISSKNTMFGMNMIRDSVLSKNYISDNINHIELNTVDAGTHKRINGTIKPKEITNINDFSRDLTITLTGTHVSDDGQTRTDINKTITLRVDWYGKTQTYINPKSSTAQKMLLRKELEKFNTYEYVTITTSETYGKLPIKSTGVVIDIPKFNGYAPESVQCKGGTYDPETQKLTVYRNSTVLDNGDISNEVASYNQYSISLKYPIEAYLAMNNRFTQMVGGGVTTSYAELRFKVNAFYEGYNNPNYSTTVSSSGTRQLSHIINVTCADFEADVEEDQINHGYLEFADAEWLPRKKEWALNKNELLDAWDNNEDYYYYTVKWSGYWNSSETGYSRMVMGEYDSDYLDKLGLGYCVTDYAIWVENFEEVLGENGEIRIYDVDQNQALPGVSNGKVRELVGYIRKHTTEGDVLALTGLEEMSSEEIQAYLEGRQAGAGFSKENPYIIGDDPLMPLHSAAQQIEVATTGMEQKKKLDVYVVKKLNVNMLKEYMTREQLEKVEYISSNVKVTHVEDAGFTTGGLHSSSGECSLNVNLVNDKSYATIAINQNQFYTYNPDETVLNRKITVSAKSEELGDALWKDGIFVIEMPEAFIYMNVNKIDLYNTEIKEYDSYKENGKYFIKINTKNQIEEENIRFVIDADFVVDPGIRTRTDTIRLYCENSNCKKYLSETKDKYDINNNTNIEEYVGVAGTMVYFRAPNTLIAVQTVSNYDELGSVTVSPNIAEITKEARSADINISLTNNYNRTITDVKLLGRVPVKNNKYIITENNIGSTFTANMTDKGISIPEELKDIATVYYSVNETPSDDLTDVNNNWVLAENVQNWNDIKSYLIDLGNYVLPIGKQYSFKYGVTIPEGLEYNDIAYSTYAVIYDYMTEDSSKIHSETEPAKIGIKVTRLYNIELTKLKENFNLPVKGAEYELIEVNSTIEPVFKKRIISNEQGLLKANGLNVNSEYELKEVSAPENYLINNKVIKFKVVEQDDKSLSVVMTQNTFADIPQMVVKENKDVLQAKLEDEPKYQLNVTYYDTTANEIIEDVIVKFEDEDRGTADGTFSFTGLLPDETYTIEDFRIPGYKLSTHTFSLTKEENEYEMSTTGDARVESIVNNAENDLVQVNVVIEKAGNKRFNLEIIKVEQDSSKTSLDDLKKLEGAKYTIQQVDDNEYTTLDTDENGTIRLNKLYQYEADKELTGRYVIKEEVAPYGYVLNSETIGFKVITENDELKLVLENEASLTSFKGAIIDGNTVRIVLEDAPLFRLTKRDSKTGELLANAKFVIYELDENSDKIGFAKDISGNYVGIMEDGKYVVVTDENGTIQLPLKDGTYLIEEIEAPDGYTGELEETFVVKSEVTVKTDIIPEVDDSADYVIEEKEKIFEINYVEDLLDLGKAMVEDDNTFADTKVVLMSDLDFTNPDSYKSDLTQPTTYGDINGNDEVEDLKTELTTEIGWRCLGEYDYTYERNGNTYTETAIKPFSGVFDGQNHSIKYYTNGRKDAGLFGALVNASVCNLTIIGFPVIADTSVYGAAGSIAPYAAGDLKLINCTNNSACVVGKYAGGLIGKYDSYRINDASTGIGHKIIIKDCTSNPGSINGTYVGGMISYIYDEYTNIDLIKIKGCTNKATMTDSNSEYTAGIIGYILMYTTKNVEILDCKNEGSLFGDDYVGGIVGDTQLQREGLEKIKIDNCTNTGYINGKGYVGGIASYISTASYPVDECKITNCKNEQTIAPSNNSGYYFGGIVGYISSYNTTEGKNKFIIDNCINKGNVYASSSSSGGGILGCCWGSELKISNCTNTGNLSGAYRLGGIAGQFASTGTNKSISNCKVYGINISPSNGNYGGAGGILGYDDAGNTVIDSCSVTDITIAYNPKVGGIVGSKNVGSLNIDNCLFRGTISNGEYVGGIIGHNSNEESYTNGDKISNCISEATITGKQYVGGIVGAGSYTIEKCISKGKITISGDSAHNCGGIVGSSWYGTARVKDCINYANIYATNTNTSLYVGGINGQRGYVENSYNFGNITCSGSEITYMGGIVAEGSAKNCFNKGNIYALKANQTGGIVGSINGNIENCYNSGNITIVNQFTSYNGVGGIAGRNGSAEIRNCYNEGRITGPYYVGGIVGYYSGIINCYNIGDVIATTAPSWGDTCASPLCTNGVNYTTTTNNSYYLDSANYVGDIIDDAGISKTWDEMISDEFYNALNTDEVWVKRDGLAPTLNLKLPIFYYSEGELTELNVINSKKEYYITTDCSSGGTITGKGYNPFETVIYKNNNIRAITMTPNENYYITSILVNGNKIEYELAEDGTYTIPAGYFTNVDENKHVYVEFGTVEQKINLTINKTDEDDATKKLPNAEFELTSIRKAGVNNIGGSTSPIWGNNRYYFAKIETEDGYIWRNDNINYGNSTKAISYSNVNLSELTGTYVLDLDVSISSEEGKDIGYVTVSTTSPIFSVADARTSGNELLEISGEVNNRTASIELEGGAQYYITFGYEKDADGFDGSDTMTINSFTIKEKDTENYLSVSLTQGNTYEFVQKDGKYVTNNSKDIFEGLSTNAMTGSTANSMMVLSIPNDGTEYEIEVDVSISGDEGKDFGFLRNTTNSGGESYEKALNADDVVFMITGKVDHAVYRFPIQTGSPTRFLQFGYYNGANSRTGTDTMTINSVKLIHKEGTFTTDENGSIELNLDPDATYELKEIKAPEGYVLDPTVKSYVFTEDTTLPITNSAYPKVTTHYYLKENGEYTTKKVAEDAVLYGNPGDKYDTELLKLEGLNLEKDNEGEYVVPNNAYGVFGDSDIVVTYYYEAEPIELKIHHYTEGTFEKLAEDEIIDADAEVTFDDEGNYEVSIAQTYELASNNNYRTLTRGTYSLAGIRSSVTDNLSITDTLSYNTDAILTYTYDDKTYDISTRVIRHEETGKDDENNDIVTLVAGGTISGEDQIAYETLEQNGDATKDIVITADDGYVIKKVTITSTADDETETSKVLYGEGSEECEVTYTGDTKQMTLSRFENVQADKLVSVEFMPQASQVIVHHIKEGTNEDYQTETVSGNVGGEYTTSPITITGYELVRNTLNTRGLITEETIHVYYFYDLVDCSINFRYEDINSNEVLDTDSVTGKCGNTITIADYAKDITNYVLVESPDEETAIYTLDEQTYVFKYAKNASVRTKHIKQGTEVSVADDVVENGYEGKAYTTSPVTLEKYDLVVTPANAEGTMAVTDETSETLVVYEYALKAAKVNVKYIDINKETENVVETETINGHVDDPYNVEGPNVPNGYVLMEENAQGESILPTNTQGTMTVSDIDVIYYVAKVASVRTKHIKQGTQVSVADDVVENGYEGKAYTTSPVTLEKYDLVVTPANAEGTMAVTDETSETLVVYEYALKAAKVNVKYVDINKETENVVATETINGHVDDPYNVEGPNVPNGYVLMEENAQGESILPTNTQGTMTVSDIDVIYYVAKAASVRAIYVEEGTTSPKLAPDYTEAGYEGKTYTTSAKEVDGYTLKATPANANGTMTVTDESSETLVVYEYVKVEANVVERYVDINSNEVVSRIDHPGHVGDSYEIEEPTVPEGYVLMEENAQGESILPTNTEGEMTEEEIVVTYYVARAASVRAIYVKEGTTSPKLAEDYTEAGYEGKAYTTTAKVVDGYTLKAMPLNATGTMSVTETSNETLVVYEYTRNQSQEEVDTKVVEKYVDINSNETVSSIDHNGHVGDPYKIEEPTVPNGYVLIEENAQGESILPTNTEGTMTEEEIVVTYYVAKAAKVTVKYIDTDTNANLAEVVEIPGYEGKAYTTEEKEFEEYNLVEIEGTTNGNMTAGNQEVIYKYEKEEEPVRDAYVRVIYIDTETKEKIEEDTIIEGYEGKPYQTTAKEITDYELLLVPTNARGTMAVTEDTNGNINNETLVTYIYMKRKPTKVVEKYVDINTNKTVEEKEHPGKVGDAYEVTPTIPEGYVLMEKDKDGKDILPENTKGRMTEETIEVVYYVAKDAKVTVRYIVRYDNENVGEDVIIPGYEGKEYKAEEKKVDGYELVGVEGEKEGKMKAGDNVVTFYYAKKATGIIPQTGINVFLYAMFAVTVIVVANGSIFVIYKFKK